MRIAFALALLLSAGCRPGEASSDPGVKFEAASRLARIPLSFPDGRTITVEVAEDDRARERGLMFRSRLEPDYGMIFLFPEERELTFWMKNTFVDLDMVFIGADKRVTVVRADVPRSRPDTPDAAVARRSGRGRYVLELPAGEARRRKLKPGDRLEFSR